MSVNLKGKDYRNAQEQILENAKDIEALQDENTTQQNQINALISGKINKVLVELDGELEGGSLSTEIVNTLKSDLNVIIKRGSFYFNISSRLYDENQNPTFNIYTAPGFTEEPEEEDERYIMLYKSRVIVDFRNNTWEYQQLYTKQLYTKQTVDTLLSDKASLSGNNTFEGNMNYFDGKIGLYSSEDIQFEEEANLKLQLASKQNNLEFNPTVPSGTTPTPLANLRDGEDYYFVGRVYYRHDIMIVDNNSGDIASFSLIDSNASVDTFNNVIALLSVIGTFSIMTIGATGDLKIGYVTTDYVSNITFVDINGTSTTFNSATSTVVDTPNEL